VTYGSGNFAGAEYRDTVDVGGGLIIPNQSIGVATSSEGFSDVDGILGVGPIDLTIGTLSPLAIEPVPTVTDNLFIDGIIPAAEIGIFFQPTTSAGADDGEMTWGAFSTHNERH
jgi:cathepsin E